MGHGPGYAWPREVSIWADLIKREDNFAMAL